MEVFKPQRKPLGTNRILGIGRLAVSGALLPTVVCAALQLSSLRAAEPGADNYSDAARLTGTATSVLMREASHPVPSSTHTSSAGPARLTSVTNDLPYSPAATFASSGLPLQRPIGQVSIDIRPKSKAGSHMLPSDQTSQQLPFVVAGRADELRSRIPIERVQSAASFPYQPLYFEQVNLERYGRYHSRLQPATSALRFFATIPTLPYAVAVHNPHVAYHWNWPYAAGWAAPRVRETPPFQPRAALVEAGAVTGLAFLLP